MGESAKNKRLFVKVPAEVIESSKNSSLGIMPYLAIAVSYGLNKRALFTLDDFRGFSNKSSAGLTKQLLIDSLFELQNQGRITFVVNGSLFYINVLDKFSNCKTFAKIYIDEIHALHQEQCKKQTCKLLYMLSYLRLHMNKKGVYYKTYAKIADSLNISGANVSRLCHTLQDLDIVLIKQIDNGTQPDHTYKSNAKFQIFADKSNSEWRVGLKELEGKFATDAGNLY